MSSSLLLSCSLKQPSHFNKPRLVSNSKPKLLFSPLFLKPNKSLTHFTVSLSKNDSVAISGQEKAQNLLEEQLPAEERKNGVEAGLKQEDLLEDMAKFSKEQQQQLEGVLKQIVENLQALHEKVTNKLKESDVTPVAVNPTSDDGVLKVDPKPKKGVVSTLIDTMVTICVKLYHGPVGQSPFLQGNFAPVENETPPVELSVIEGTLPSSLNGVFVRNGPNPQFDPPANYVWFDGDGMLHAIRIQNGKATYVSRYIETSRFKQERYLGRAELTKFGDWQGMFGLFTIFVQALKAQAGVFDMSYGWGSANESLIYHHGKLMALEDFDRPYVVKLLENGDLETLGINSFGRRLMHNLTPHPKIDPVTGELFTFGVSYFKPYVTYRVVTKDGFMKDPVHINVPGPTYMHDFAITERYAIFMDLPFNFSPQDMVKNNEWIFSFDPTKSSRFGILPRYAENDDQIKWFTLPNGFIFHNANAWEEGEDVVLIACRMEIAPTNNKNPAAKPTTMFIGTSTESQSFTLPTLYEMRFNMESGQASQKKLSSTFVDHPKVNESLIGRKIRYVYATMYDATAQIPAIIKFDLQGGAMTHETKLNLGEKVYGSEVVFVPRQTGESTEEDDGYLIFFAHNENNRKSYLYVINAQTMEKDPVAMVELPEGARVPHGFHSLFITEKQLQENNKV